MFASDPIFSDPQLAVLYDEFDNDRRDLDVYVELIRAELGATTVLDIGCGTGTLALLLAGRGCEVTGVDPAAASLDIAKAKPYADQVRWHVGDAETFATTTDDRGRFDVAVMTGNVAQVFVDHGQWLATLDAVATCLRPGGFLIFETRDPAKEAWLGWTPETSARQRDVDGIGVVSATTELLSVDGSLVSFRHRYEFAASGKAVTSDSTLRFRSKAEIMASLDQSGFVISDIRDAPDRPGLEFVFIANRMPDTAERTN